MGHPRGQSASRDTMRFITWGMTHDAVGEPPDVHHIADTIAHYADASAHTQAKSQ